MMHTPPHKITGCNRCPGSSDRYPLTSADRYANPRPTQRIERTARNFTFSRARYAVRVAPLLSDIIYRAAVKITVLSGLVVLGYVAHLAGWLS